MATKFNLQNFLSQNREIVISEYEELKKEKFFNNITLRNFMIQVMNLMAMQNIKSEKRASQMLPYILGDVYFNNSSVTGLDMATEKLKKIHDNQQWDAII
jgi:hypothetical protein